MKRENKTILIVDDSKTNIDILMGLLEGYDIMVALNGDSAVHIAEKDYVDLVLLDIVMPGIDGYETCRRLKGNRQTGDIPVIFITAKTDEESIEKGFEAGAVDYVTKPFMSGELLARVRTHLKLQSVIDHLDHLSSYDQMTGIYNRRKFFELGEKLFSERPDNLYAMMMDIDKFKAVNDTHGHPAGDRVIRAVAKTMRDSLKFRDAVLGRIGGEEFAALFHSPTIEEAFRAIEKVRKSVESLVVEIDHGITLEPTVSGGLACFSKKHRTLDSLLKDSDDALYESKKSGRNKSIFRT